MEEHGAAELEKYLTGITFPVRRADLVAHVQRRGADRDTVERMTRIEDQDYESVEAVEAAFTYEGDTTMHLGHVTVYDQ